MPRRHLLQLRADGFVSPRDGRAEREEGDGDGQAHGSHDPPDAGRDRGTRGAPALIRPGEGRETGPLSSPLRTPVVQRSTVRTRQWNRWRSEHVRNMCRGRESADENVLTCVNQRFGHFTPTEMPIIHSANAADSRGRPDGPGSAGGGAGYPRTCSQRRIACSYSPHATVPWPARGAGVSAVAAMSRPAPLWCPLPGRPRAGRGRSASSRCPGWAAAFPRRIRLSRLGSPGRRGGG